MEEKKYTLLFNLSFYLELFFKTFKKKSRLSNLIADYIKMSTKIYFPPFTFKNILTNYKNKKEVNFITNKIFIKKIKKSLQFLS